MVSPNSSLHDRARHRDERQKGGKAQANKVALRAWVSPTAFSVRAVRNATRHASLGSQGDMHVFAARVVQACPDNLDLRWRSMWREG